MKDNDYNPYDIWEDFDNAGRRDQKKRGRKAVSEEKPRRKVHKPRNRSRGRPKRRAHGSGAGTQDKDQTPLTFSEISQVDPEEKAKA